MTAGNGEAASTYNQNTGAKELDRVAMVAEQIARFNQAERQLFARIMVRQNGASLFESESADQALFGAMGGKAYVAAPGQPYPSGGGLSGPGLTLDNVEDAFRYQPWDSEQALAGDAIRELLTMTAKAFLRQVPAGPLRTRALNHLIDARMIANAAITFRGRF